MVHANDGKLDAMRYNSVAGLAALAMLAVVGDAHADEQYAKRMFAENFAPQGKSYACFVRRYDAAHLAQHRKQTVTVMKLLVTAETLPESKGLSYSFRLGLNFRNRHGNFDSSGDCGDPRSSQVSADKMQLACNIDCDGGGMSIELAHADKSTLLRLDSIRIWQNNKPEEEGFDLTGGADDRVFRLDRALFDECRALVTDRKELAAMRHK
jgi:hypothetical protein